MKRTLEFVEYVCRKCKHDVKTPQEEPCKSCVVSGWEPIKRVVTETAKEKP
jgi:hypothetical protein